MQIYRLKDNEDVYTVARDFGISTMKISEDNELSAHSALPKNRELLIIRPTRTYNVRSGDTPDSIARRFNVKKEALKRMNPELRGRERLYSGQLLTVKCEGGGYGMIGTNGYLYKGCGTERLLRIMPYLGYVTVCSALYKDGSIHSTFASRDAVSIVLSHGKIPLLRIYLTEMPTECEIKGFVDSATILARSGGFKGVTPHGLHAFCAVGHAGGIAKIEEGFVGQLLAHGAEHGHAAHAGIEEADGQFAQVRSAGGEAVGLHHASASFFK